VSGGDRTDARIVLLSLNNYTCEAHEHVHSQQMAVEWLHNMGQLPGGDIILDFDLPWLNPEYFGNV